MSIEQKVTRKLRAILSADVKGYSLLMSDDEIHTIETLKSYRQIISEYIEKYSGRVVDSPGDNLLAEFRSAVEAVECAIEIQKQLMRENARYVEEKRVQFRIGINVGDVVEDDGRIYGDGVNIASRVEGLAEASGICISGRVYDQVENKLNLDYYFLGEKTVKNIKRPIRVYKIVNNPSATNQNAIKANNVFGRKWINVTIAIMLILAVSLFFFWNSFFRLPPIYPKTGKTNTLYFRKGPSIAVLPLDNLTGDPEEDYFSDGLTESIIAGLSICPKLFVIARNTVFTFKGKPVNIQEVAEELGVQYVVEGSVQKTADRIRITAQLIDGKNGQHVWAETYDRKLQDIFDLQDEITLNIITAMSVKLTEGEQANLRFNKSKNLKAYLKVLRGMEYLFRSNRSDMALARQMAEEAIALDPDNESAYSLLAVTYYLDLWYIGGLIASNYIC